MRAQSYAAVAGVEAPGDDHADFVTERTHSALYALADAAGEEGASFMLGQVTAAIVADACKTGQLYSDAVSDARALTSQIASISEDDRDGILDGHLKCLLRPHSLADSGIWVIRRHSAVGQKTAWG